MPAYTYKSTELQKQPVASSGESRTKDESHLANQIDQRPKAQVQRKLQDMADQRLEEAKGHVQTTSNRTGLPGNLKSGVESLSGYSMDDVRVHYNSSKPAQFQAHAFAQGTDIHLASGQERHLAHEAWHVVQQKQGRVKSTFQMKGKVEVNDDPVLEREADVMGSKARSFQVPSSTSTETRQLQSNAGGNVVQLVELAKDKLNVIGEEHGESQPRRDLEQVYTAKATGSPNYEQEGAFRRGDGHRADPSGLRFLYLWSRAEANGLTNELTANSYALATIKNQLQANQGRIGATDIFKGYFTLSTSLGMSWTGEVARSNSANDPHNQEVQAIAALLNQHLNQFINAFSNNQERFQAYYDPDYEPDSEDELSEDDLSEDELDAPLMGQGAFASEEELNAALNPVVTHGHGLYQALQLYMQAKVTHGLGNEQHVANQRSKEMHAQANNQSNVLGVWKIGDLHRRQMERMDNKQYHLVSRDAFNNLLIKFDKDVGMLMGASIGAVLGGVLGASPLGAFLGALAGGLFGRVAGHFVGKYRKGVRNVTLGEQDTPDDWT